MRRVRASFIYNERTRPGRGGRRATAFARRRAPRERGQNGPRVSFPIANARQENFCMMCAAVAPRAAATCTARRAERPAGAAFAPSRGPRAAARAAGRAGRPLYPCALGAVYSVAVCLSMGGAQQASIQAARRPSTLAGVFLARGKVAAEDFVSGRASPTCPWRPRRSKPLAVLDPGYNLKKKPNKRLTMTG